MISLLAATTVPLPDSKVFWWGLVGGLAALLVTQMIPAAVAILKGGGEPVVTFWRVMAALVIVGGYACLGGLAALVIGDATTTKDAIVYGMAWEAILGGAIKTGRAALPPKPPS